MIPTRAAGTQLPGLAWTSGRRAIGGAPATGICAPDDSNERVRRADLPALYSPLTFHPVLPHRNIPAMSSSSHLE